MEEKRGILEMPTNSSEIEVIKNQKRLTNVFKHIENAKIKKYLYKK